ncbi:hypothetical protein LSH36_45g11018 [Paralvinella palmiformis]|uniref:MICOS complex subunit MIC60 n=1 Tax=Paralvinella palmiformis TaxID=53620 RepID=A0AAD9NEN5_9ANNE|nr:hypothetical protein LSH36_45g11018 [Paralvinella palmiformis]
MVNSRTLVFVTVENGEMWRASRNIPSRVSHLGSLRNKQSALFVHQSRLCSSKASNPQTQNAKPFQSEDAPPPPSPKKGGSLFFKLLGLTLVGGSGVIGYAWYDKNFRGQIEERIPYSREAFNYVFQYLPSLAESVPEKSQSLAISNDEIKDQSLMKKKEPLSLESKEPAVQDEKVAKTEVVTKKDEKRLAEERKKEAADQVIRDKEFEKAAENDAVENILKVVLTDAENAVIIAIELQTAAAAATRDHTKKLRQAMDLQGENKESDWEAATAAFTAKTDALSRAESATENARVQMETAQAMVDAGRSNNLTKKNKTLGETEKKLNNLNYDLKKAVSENTKAQSEAQVMSEYRSLVKKGREQFRKEVESLTPEVFLGKKGSKLSEEELNALIAHAHRRIDQLQRQLAEQLASEQLRIDAALEKQQEADEKLLEERIKQEREKLERDFLLTKDQWDLDARINFELELRQQLMRQAAAHSDHLTEVLKVQEKELGEKFDKILEERLAEEKVKFQNEIAGWIARLKGIETAIDNRADLERQGRKAQELWLACQMLYNTLENGPNIPQDVADSVDKDRYETRMRPLIDEFMAILDAGSNHPFVNSVLETIPNEAIKRGVWTEKELIARFDKVHKVCRRVALVDEAGGTLFNYFLSYLQSLFVFTAAKPFSSTEKVEVDHLDTFSILDNAKHHLERGDLEMALRFMNQLNGEPRKVAADWILEARLFLETRQAADALLAHASNNSLGSLIQS